MLAPAADTFRAATALPGRPISQQFGRSSIPHALCWADVGPAVRPQLLSRCIAHPVCPACRHEVRYYHCFRLMPQQHLHSAGGGRITPGQQQGGAAWGRRWPLNGQQALLLGSSCGRVGRGVVCMMCMLWSVGGWAATLVKAAGGAARPLRALSAGTAASAAAAAVPNPGLVLRLPAPPAAGARQVAGARG